MYICVQWHKRALLFYGAVRTACGWLAGVRLDDGVQRKHRRLEHRVGDDAVLGMRPFGRRATEVRRRQWPGASSRGDVGDPSAKLASLGRRWSVPGMIRCSGFIAQRRFRHRRGTASALCFGAVRFCVNRVSPALRRSTRLLPSTRTSAAGTPRR